jgi:hypothetical protein
MTDWAGRCAMCAFIGVTALVGCFSKSSGGSGSGANFGAISTEALAVAIDALSGDIETTDIGGTACGPLDKTVSCPKGGTVALTGTSTNCPTPTSSGVENIDFTYTMTGCADAIDGVTVTLTGVATHSGTLTTVGGTLTAQNVQFNATSSVIVVASQQGSSDVTNSCTFALTYDLSSGTSTLDGTLCGEMFTASFADQ